MYLLYNPTGGRDRRRAALRSLIWAGSGALARHMRGLEEKIWKVLAPNSAAWSAAFSRDPAVEVWMPSRKNTSYRILKVDTYAK